MKFFRQKYDTSNKHDNSPVTKADINSELKLRELIKQKYPDHGIIAEEFENTQINSDFI